MTGVQTCALPIFKVDQDALEVRDLVDFKKITGVKWEDAFTPKEKVVNGKAVIKDGQVVKEIEVEPEYLQALIFIVQRSSDETFTFEDAGRVKVADIEWSEELPENPPTAASEIPES